MRVLRNSLWKDILCENQQKYKTHLEVFSLKSPFSNATKGGLAVHRNYKRNQNWNRIFFLPVFVLALGTPCLVTPQKVQDFSQEALSIRITIITAKRSECLLSAFLARWWVPRPKVGLDLAKSQSKLDCIRLRRREQSCKSVCLSSRQRRPCPATATTPESLSPSVVTR